MPISPPHTRTEPGRLGQRAKGVEMNEAEIQLEQEYLDTILSEDMDLSRFFECLIEHQARGKITEGRMFEIIREVRLTEDSYYRCN